MSSETPKNLAQRFFGFTVLVLAGIVTLWLALELLAKIWAGIVLVVAIAAAFYIGWLLYKRWRDRW